MSKRLQVLLEEHELAQIQQVARARRQTVSALVRQALRAACEKPPSRDAEVKLRAIRKAAQYSFPSGEPRQMLAEIEQGYLE